MTMIKYFAICLMIFISACGSASDMASAETVDESASAIGHNPGEYPDCTGSYSLISVEGDACGEFNRLQLLEVGQDENMLTFNRFEGFGDEPEYEAIFLDGDLLDGMVDNFMFEGEIAWAREYHDDHKCTATIYVNHGIVIACFMPMTDYHCTQWYRKQPSGDFSEEYPAIWGLYKDGNWYSAKTALDEQVW
jgi:hypothetical protein